MRTQPSDARRRLLSLADGALVQGPGTGTSDSIRARLSDGEFVLPADTVRKIGVKNLRDLIMQTHEPSGQPYHPARFTDGGLAEDELRRNREALIAQIPTGDNLTAPKADGSLDGWSNTELGRNVNNAAAALPGVASAVPAVVKTGGAISAGLNAASKLLNAGAVAGGTSAIPSPTAAPASATLATNPTDQRLAGGLQESPASSMTDASAELPKTATAPGSNITKTVDASGRTTYSGNNIGPGATINGKDPGGAYVEVTGGAGSPSGYGGAPVQSGLSGVVGGLGVRTGIGDFQSADAATMAANLRDGVDINRGVGGRGPTMQILGGAKALDLRDPDYIARRNAEVGAKALRGEWDRYRDGEIDNFGRATGRGGSAAQAAFQTLLSDQSAERTNLAKARSDTTRANTELGLEQTRQRGESARAALTAAGQAGRNQIERGRLAMDQATSAFQNRASQRLENAQLALEGAKTPEELRTARERLMALAGKKDDDVWAHSPGGQVVDQKTQQLVTQPGTIYNRRTGETRADSAQAEQPAAAPSKESLVVGRMYQTPRGRAVWDGKQFKMV